MWRYTRVALQGLSQATTSNENTLTGRVSRKWSLVGASISSMLNGVAGTSQQLLSSLGGRTPHEETAGARLFQSGMALEVAVDRAPQMLQLSFAEVRAHDGAPQAVMLWLRRPMTMADE